MAKVAFISVFNDYLGQGLSLDAVRSYSMQLFLAL